MKLLIITCIEEFKKDTMEIFLKAKINAFSNTEIHGFKMSDDQNLISNWFSTSNNMVNSILFFTFINKDKIDGLLSGVEEFNKSTKSNNPMRAVVLEIEKFV